VLVEVGLETLDVAQIQTPFAVRLVQVRVTKLRASREVKAVRVPSAKACESASEPCAHRIAPHPPDTVSHCSSTSRCRLMSPAGGVHPLWRADAVRRGGRI